MNLKKLLAIAGSAAMLACLSACSDSKDDSSKEKETEATTEVVTEAPTEPEILADDDADDADDDDLDMELDSDNPEEMVLSILQMGFESSFGENMYVDYEEDAQNYIVSIWQDGLAENIDGAAATDAWSTMIDTLTSAVDQMISPIRQIDPDANVTLNILSDVNQEDVLLTIYNGEVTFNAAE